MTPGEVQRGPAYCLGGIRHKGGVNLIQALVRNVGTVVPMLREKLKWRPHESESTEAGTVAEQPVVARKSRNGDGAKGLYRSALSKGQPAMGGAVE